MAWSVRSDEVYEWARPSGLVEDTQNSTAQRLPSWSEQPTSVQVADASYLNAFNTSEQLHDCSTRLRHNKCVGIEEEEG